MSDSVMDKFCKLYGELYRTAAALAEGATGLNEFVFNNDEFIIPKDQLDDLEAAIDALDQFFEAIPEGGPCQ